MIQNQNLFIIIFNAYVKDKKIAIDGYFLNGILSDESYLKAESECYDHFPQSSLGFSFHAHTYTTLETIYKL